MPSSSTDSDEADRVRGLASELLGTSISSADPLASGGNSRAYLLTGQASGRLVAKITLDRSRLSREFGALEFLTDGGVDQVPKPVALHPREALAVYRYVDGDAAGPPGEADIDRAVDFMQTLSAQTVRDEAKAQPPASEACFSLAEIVQSIESRLQRLQKEAVVGHQGLDSFLSVSLGPVFERISDEVSEAAVAEGTSIEDLLSSEERVLSPSDFGFHNAIRTPDGNLVFVDFEHFGWDDPAKTISDFVLHPHPDMAMPDVLRRRFVKQMVESDRLRGRLAMVYPLFGLKWCTILLNEFVPRDLNRRAFADRNPDVEARRQTQLAKAEQMLRYVNENGMRFPYFEEERGS